MLIIFGGAVNRNSIFSECFYYYFIPATCNDNNNNNNNNNNKTFRENAVAIDGTPKDYSNRHNRMQP
jgi:hypothetical protein